MRYIFQLTMVCPLKFSEEVQPLNVLRLLHFRGSVLNSESELPFPRSHVILDRLISTQTDVERAVESSASFLSLG